MYCAFASDSIAIRALKILSVGTLPTRELKAGELPPEDATFLYGDPNGSFSGHHLRVVRENGEDHAGHLTYRGFLIPEGVRARQVIALRLYPANESSALSYRRDRGLATALSCVHYARTQERICNYRPQRSSSGPKSRHDAWKSGHHARIRERAHSSFCDNANRAHA